MSQPAPYSPATDFSNEESTGVGGRSTIRTAALDTELANIATTVAQIRANLALMQRDDGHFLDQTVDTYNLTAAVVLLIGSTGFNLRNSWVTATAYAVKDMVKNGTGTYVCNTAHTSAGAFATDLAAGKWTTIFDSSAYTAAGVSFSPTGVATAVTVQSAIAQILPSAALLPVVQAADLATARTALGVGTTDQVTFTATGSGAQQRTATAVLTESIHLLNYLQTADTDLTSAFTRAIAAMTSNGRIIIPDRNDLPNVTTGNIALPSTKRVWIEGNGYQLVHNGGNDVFQINNGGYGYTSPRHVITGIWFDKSGGTRGTGRAISLIDSSFITLEDLAISYYNEGIKQANSAFWAEHNCYRSIDLNHNNTALTFDKGASAYASMATTRLDRVSISQALAVGTPTGIKLTATTSMYGSVFDDVVIFIDKANAIAMDIAGSLAVFGTMRIENNNASAGTTAFKVAATAVIDADLYFKFDGVMTLWAVTGTPAIAGFKARLIDGYETEYRKDANAAANQSPSACRPIVYGSTATIFTAGATPNVAGLQMVTLTYAGATTVTGFNGGAEGQILSVYWGNTNATLQHNGSAGGFRLAGSANIVPTNVADRVVLQFKDQIWHQMAAVVHP